MINEAGEFFIKLYISSTTVHTYLETLQWQGSDSLPSSSHHLRSPYMHQNPKSPPPVPTFGFVKIEYLPKYIPPLHIPGTQLSNMVWLPTYIPTLFQPEPLLVIVQVLPVVSLWQNFFDISWVVSKEARKMMNEWQARLL